MIDPVVKLKRKIWKRTILGIFYMIGTAAITVMSITNGWQAMQVFGAFGMLISVGYTDRIQGLIRELEWEISKPAPQEGWLKVWEKKEIKPSFWTRL